MVYFVCCCLYSFLALCNVAVSASESHQSVVAFGFFLLLFFGASDLHFRSQFAGFQKKLKTKKKKCLTISLKFLWNFELVFDLFPLFLN